MIKKVYERVRNFFARKGIKGFLLAIARRINLYLFQRPYWTVMHYVHSRFRAKRIPSFVFMGKEYGYVYGRKNFTWRNERIMEVPIAWSAIEDTPWDKVLEVGNVLGNYYSSRHDVLDKYEKGEDVINEDALTFYSPKKYDRIVSISTLEHAGWDWPEEKDPGKIPVAIENLKKMIAPGGIMLITMPLGYNSFLDEIIENKGLGLEMHFMKRISADNEWKEVPYAEVKGAKYNEPFPSANGILVGIYHNG